MFLKTSAVAVVRFPPLVANLAAHPLCMEYRTMEVFCYFGHSQNEAEEARSPRKQLAKIFTGALDQFSIVRKTSVTAPPEQISWLRYRSQPLVPP